MDRNIRRKRRRIIYKPDYAGLHQVAVAKRIVGILLALVLTAGVGYLTVRLVVPAVWSALQPSPVRQEEREEQAEERAREKGKTLLFDEKTDLPLYENNVNLFVINEQNPADDSFEIKLKTVSGIRVDERIAPALEAMVEAAWADEAEIELLEGYVSYEEQKALFDEQVDLLMLQGVTKIMSYSYAKDRVQPPGEVEVCDFPKRPGQIIHPVAVKQGVVAVVGIAVPLVVEHKPPGTLRHAGELAGEQVLLAVKAGHVHGHSSSIHGMNLAISLSQKPHSCTASGSS